MTKGDIRSGQKACVSQSFFFVYKVLESEFCVGVYHHINQLVVQEFFSKRSDFSAKRQKLNFFVFTVLPMHIKIQ